MLTCGKMYYQKTVCKRLVNEQTIIKQKDGRDAACQNSDGFVLLKPKLQISGGLVWMQILK